MRSIRSSRPFQDGAWRLAEHGGGSGDPQQNRAPLIVQTTRARTISASRGDRRFAHDARRQGLEPLFLVPTGRGNSCRTSPPRSTTRVLASLYRFSGKYDRRMLVTPSALRTTSRPFWRTPGTGPIRRSGPTQEAGGCSGGTHYMGYGRMGMSPLAPTSRLTRALRKSKPRTSGPPRNCSPIFARRSSLGDDAGSAR